jgi:ergothioneine biosynthesis protein EgtB
MTDTVTTVEPATLPVRFERVRAHTEDLAAPLSPEDQTVQSMPDVSPTKWHRAHTSWFFETFLLEPSLPGYRAFHPEFGYLFNSYYEGVGDRYPRARRGDVSRPGAAEVSDYRLHVDDAMHQLLDVVHEGDTAGLAELGLHHEQQHQELLLMDIKHVLSCNPMHPAYCAAPPSDADSTDRAAVARRRAWSGLPLCWIDHPGGLVEVGYRGDSFAFDNEAPRHAVYLEPFRMSERPVTCGAWRAFMEDGGYRRADLWLSDGWAMVQAEGWESPLYWIDRDGEWWIFTLNGARPIDAAEPVCHVSYYEADAFARWAGFRLPTEQEWEVVAGPEPTPGAGAADGPLVLHPRPLDAGAPGVDGLGIATSQGGSLFGDVWQWTSSPYSPYPGFHPAAGAVGEYNGKFMVNQHVLRGGCCVTPPGHVRGTYRNFFPPAARWPFTGLRLASDA